MSAALASAVLARAVLAGTPLDDFLAGADHTADDRLRQAGVGLALFGVLLTVGVLALLAAAHRGPRAEIRALLRLAAGAGCLTLLGGVAELAGIARRFEVGWSDAIDLDVSSAAMLRMLAGGLVLLGLFDHVAPTDPGDVTYPDEQQRWVPSGASSFGIVGALVGAASFAFDGHTVTQGSRAMHSLANVVHVLAGGVWFGGIVALVVIAASRHRAADRPPVSDLVVRYSSIATLALLVVALAGTAMSLLIVDDLADYTATEWGRRLIVKMVAVAVAAAIGAYNHFVVVPRLTRDPIDDVMTRRVHTTLTVEALVLGFVVVATVFLVNGSIA